jgi:hypothetical protein
VMQIRVRQTCTSCSSADTTHRMSVSVAAAFVKKSSLHAIGYMYYISDFSAVSGRKTDHCTAGACIDSDAATGLPQHTPQLRPRALELVLLTGGFLHLVTRGFKLRLHWHSAWWGECTRGTCSLLCLRCTHECADGMCVCTTACPALPVSICTQKPGEVAGLACLAATSMRICCTSAAMLASLASSARAAVVSRSSSALISRLACASELRAVVNSQHCRACSCQDTHTVCAP